MHEQNEAAAGAASEKDAAPERVTVVDVEDYTEPAARDGYYAIYLRLSHEPSARWRAFFDQEWKRVPTGLKRDATIVTDRVRIEIHGDDMLQEQLDFAGELVHRTNIALAAANSTSLRKENDPAD